MSARYSFFVLIAIFLSLCFLGLTIATRAQAQIPDPEEADKVDTCKGERKSWTEIENELRKAGFGGPFDHNNALLAVYDRTACPNGTVNSTSSSSTSGNQVTSENYTFLEHNYVNNNLALGNTIVGMFTNICPFSKEYKCVTAISDPIKKATHFEFSEPGQNGGAIGAVGSLMVALYTPPTSTVEYLANFGESIGIAPKSAHAQVAGSGSRVIEPIRNLWLLTRNFAYLMFIVIFVAVGFMIMFRQKISSSAVITVQQALPGLIIGLILVTFSYFIAALIVDLSFVGIQLIIALFTSITVDGKLMPNAFGTEPQIRNLAENSNILQMFWSSTQVINGGDIAQAINKQAFTTLGSGGAIVIPAVLGAIQGFLVLGPVGGLGGAALGGLLSSGVGNFVISIVVTIILVLALFIQMFRLAFSLLQSYISILIFTIGGPIYILMGSVPGKGGSISTWWKGILGNALVFPAVFAGFLIAGVILAADTDYRATMPFFGGVEGDIVRILIGYGILLGLQAIPGMVKKAVGVSDQGGFAKEALGTFNAGRDVAQTFGTSVVGRPAARYLSGRLNKLNLPGRDNGWWNENVNQPLKSGIQNLGTPPKK